MYIQEIVRGEKPFQMHRCVGLCVCESVRVCVCEVFDTFPQVRTIIAKHIHMYAYVGVCVWLCVCVCAYKFYLTLLRLV